MGKHRQLALSIAACALALAPAILAQTAQPLLPPVGDIERTNWRSVSAVELERLANDLAPLLREYGCQKAEQAEYLTSTRWQSRVTVFVMQDRSAAYGAFTLLRGKGKQIDVGEAGVYYTGSGPSLYALRQFLFYQGNYLVRVEGLMSPDATEEWLRHLAVQLAARAKDQASLPNLPLYLPEEGLVAGSDAYVLGPLGLSRVAPLEQGDWAGFAYGAEVEAARYRVGRREATLLLISYPTPHIARARLADFQRLFNVNGQRGSGPAVFAKRKSTLVVLVHGVESAEEAGRLMDSVRFQQEVSWSEPTPIDDKEVISGLIGIFLGTGLIVVVTLGLGLAFGVTRLLLMSTLPGRVFDKPVENDVVFLNLQNPK